MTDELSAKIAQIEALRAVIGDAAADAAIAALEAPPPPAAIAQTLSGAGGGGCPGWHSGLGYGMSTYTDAALPYPDGFTTVASLVAQWRAWVAQGGTPSYVADNSDLNHPNQPVVGVRWEWFNQFCTWLTEQMGEVLPAGYVVQLPTEAEWEAASRGREGWRYPWGNEWQDDYATTEENCKDLGTGESTPVGCYAAGAAPCCALDMAGNVEEWTADGWRSPSGAARPFEEQDRRVVKGGSYWNSRIHVRCAARGWFRRALGHFVNGGRVVVSPCVRTGVLSSES